MVDLEARPGLATAHGRRSQASPPPTGAAARPRHRPRAPQPGPPASSMPAAYVVLVCPARPRLEARPCPATAHGRRSQASPRSSPVPSVPPAPLHRRRMWFWCTRAPKPMGAQTGSGERNIAPAWCSSSWNGASLKQKPPTHAHNRRKLAYSGVLGRIIFHGVPQQLMHGRFFFQSGPACGHRCQQLLPDRGCRGRRLYVDLPC